MAAVAGAVAAVALTTGQGQAKPKGALALIFGIIGLYVLLLFVFQTRDLSAAEAALTLLVFGHRAPGLAQQQASVSQYSLPHLVASALGHGALWVLPLAILSRSRALWAATAVLAAFILLPAGPGFVGSP